MKNKILKLVVDWLIPQSILPLLYEKYKKYFDDRNIKPTLDSIYNDNQEFFDKKVGDARQIFAGTIEKQMSNLNSRIEILQAENDELRQTIPVDKFDYVDKDKLGLNGKSYHLIHPLSKEELKSCICPTRTEESKEVFVDGKLERIEAGEKVIADFEPLTDYTNLNELPKVLTSGMLKEAAANVNADSAINKTVPYGGRFA